MFETTFGGNDYVLVLFSKKTTFSFRKRRRKSSENPSEKVAMVEE